MCANRRMRSEIEFTFPKITKKPPKYSKQMHLNAIAM